LNISDSLYRIVAKYTPKNIDPDVDLLGYPVFMTARDMAAVFIDIEEEYRIDLNELIQALAVYSMNCITDMVKACVDN